jgi:hypothetical protein
MLLYGGYQSALLLFGFVINCINKWSYIAVISHYQIDL